MAERATSAAPERGLLGSVEPTFEPEASAYRLVRDDHPDVLGAAPAENVGSGLSDGAGEGVAQRAFLIVAGASLASAVGGVVPILTNREPVDEGPGREHCQRRRKLKPEKAVAVHGVSLSRPRTFDAYVALGDIAFIAVGMGLKRVRKRSDPGDVKRFRDRQRRVEYQLDPTLAGHVHRSAEGDSVDPRSKGSPSISNRPTQPLVPS